ncbi:Putative BPI/LBP family protein [Morus notabilis]|uniref:Putative BPI/LBP family protein n=1 Tax=Morus notabilis TaxID=981085 RepID=W9RBJ5_9ROSA|nr:putative BPI/LBP family protein At1g04970 [Morus notabilis]EXB81102.1 Putative BPI/LBP family protein [Morus notabilis]
MGFLSIFTDSDIRPLLLLLLFFVPTSTQEQGFASVLISDKGLAFAKDFLIKKAISSMIPLQLPTAEKKVNIPVLGKADVVLSNITIYSADVPSSYAKTGGTGVVLIISGATANLTMNWRYSGKILFVDVSDHGIATIKVEGIDVGMTMALEDQEGTLKVSILESGCYVRGLSIKMEGGASWFYQGLVDVFEDIIRSAVEDAISSNIKEGVTMLDSLLQTLPKEIPVHDIAAMNVTFVGDPVLSKFSIELAINGLFTGIDNLGSSFYGKGLVDLVDYNASNKMAVMLLHEKVFNSAASVFFNEGYMQWTVNEEQHQSLLNTSSWKYIVPQLYKKYPNHAMELDISATSPPIIIILSNEVEATIYLDVTIAVLESSEVVPVACIALEITASCLPKIMGTYLMSTLKLKDFTTSLKWSKIGNLHIRLTKFVMSIILKTVILPYVNSNLQKGLPVPIVEGFTLENAEISCTDTELVISSDVSFVEQWHSLSRKFV